MTADATTASRPTGVRGWIDDTLFGPETGARLLIAHIGLSLLVAARAASPLYHRLAELPDALVDPVPILPGLSSMPSAGVIIAIQVVTVGAGLAAALRWRPRHTFAVAWLGLLVLAALRGSRGKVLHNDLLLLWSATPFLLAPVEVTLRDRIPRRCYGWAVRSATTIAVLIYFFAGYHKIRRSGLDWVFSDNLQNIMRWGPSVGSTVWEWPATFISDNHTVAVVLAAGALTMELAVPVVLLWRRLLPWCALAIVSLHAANYLVLGLDYWGWALTVLLLFVDWPVVLDRVRRTSSAPEAEASADG